MAEPNPLPDLTRWHKMVGLVVCIGQIAAQSVRGQADLTGTDDLSLWDKTVTVRTAGGYKDNLLLDRTASERSRFSFVGMDFSLLRFPLDGTHFLWFITAEDTRFWEGRQVTKEQLFTTVVQMKKDFANHWQWSMRLHYLYADQVTDASATEATPVTLHAVGHILGTRAGLRRDFEHGVWLEGEALLGRQLFDAPLDDFWEGGGKLILGRNYGHRSEITASWQSQQLAFDHREEFSAAGAALPGTSLRFLQHEAELSLRHNWDTQRRWRSISRLGYTRNEDAGSGYFTFDRYQVSQELRFVARPWEVRARIRCLYYNYPVQTIAPGSPARRNKTLLVASLRAERACNKHLKLFGSCEREQSLSNQGAAEYAANTVSAGLEVEF